MTEKVIEKQSASKLQYVDCLRGIAILMVIITHADKYILNLQRPVHALADYGQMGVQLFFIVSAFTLCLTFERRGSEENSLAKFYTRRYFRIAPLYYFGILLYLLYFSVVEPLANGAYPELASKYTWKNIAANILLVNDFTPGPANNKIVPGGWSIGTETTFYLLFPFIFLVYKRFSSSKKALWMIPLAGLAGCYLLVQAVMALTGLNIHNNSLLYFNIICQLPVFLMGISIYFYINRTGSTYKPKPTIYLLGFVIATIAAIGLHAISTQNFFFVPTAAGISFLFLFMYLRHSSTLNFNWLTRIGQLSYSIYLFHFIFAWLGSKFLYAAFGEVVMAEIIFAVNILLTIVLSMVVAVFSERYIEKPGIEWGKRVIERMGAKKERTFAKSAPKVIISNNIKSNLEMN